MGAFLSGCCRWVGDITIFCLISNAGAVVEMSSLKRVYYDVGSPYFKPKRVPKGQEILSQESLEPRIFLVRRL